MRPYQIVLSPGSALSKGAVGRSTSRSSIFFKNHIVRCSRSKFADIDMGASGVSRCFGIDSAIAAAIANRGRLFYFGNEHENSHVFSQTTGPIRTKFATEHEVDDFC